MSYSDFIGRKFALHQPTGLASLPQLPDSLFPHQKIICQWALKRGRAAAFLQTGLGKSRLQVSWADALVHALGIDVIIYAPLTVAAQTVREASAIGIHITHVRDLDDVRPGINITNYDRRHKLDMNRFGAIVLDESGIIKNDNSKTFQSLCEACSHIPFKLCCSATPAPNDWTELGTHAEFLGVCTQQEMLAEFFVHDGGETQVWRLKGHARKQFWKWVSSWGALVRKPSDLGYDDGLYALPPLHMHEHQVGSSLQASDGMLFAFEAKTLTERRDARKASMAGRVEACAALVNADAEQWFVWTDLNAESEALTALIPGAVEITGSDAPEFKESALLDFIDGKIRVIVTKVKIAGFGINAQGCAHQAFVGMNDSYEGFYQAVRRSWRFGQRREVNVHVFTSQFEGAVVANIKRKGEAAEEMGEELSRETAESVRAEVFGLTRETNPYNANKIIAAPAWLTTESA